MKKVNYIIKGITKEHFNEVATNISWFFKSEEMKFFGDQYMEKYKEHKRIQMKKNMEIIEYNIRTGKLSPPNIINQSERYNDSFFHLAIYFWGLSIENLIKGIYTQIKKEKSIKINQKNENELNSDLINHNLIALGSFIGYQFNDNERLFNEYYEMSLYHHRYPVSKTHNKTIFGYSNNIDLVETLFNDLYNNLSSKEIGIS